MEYLRLLLYVTNCLLMPFSNCLLLLFHNINPVVNSQIAKSFMMYTYFFA